MRRDFFKLSVISSTLQVCVLRSMLAAYKGGDRTDIRSSPRVRLHPGKHLRNTSDEVESRSGRECAHTSSAFVPPLPTPFHSSNASNFGFFEIPFQAGAGNAILLRGLASCLTKMRPSVPQWEAFNLPKFGMQVSIANLARCRRNQERPSIAWRSFP